MPYSDLFHETRSSSSRLCMNYLRKLSNQEKQQTILVVVRLLQILWGGWFTRSDERHDVNDLACCPSSNWTHSKLFSGSIFSIISLSKRRNWPGKSVGAIQGLVNEARSILHYHLQLPDHHENADMKKIFFEEQSETLLPLWVVLSLECQTSCL